MKHKTFCLVYLLPILLLFILSCQTLGQPAPLQQTPKSTIYATKVSVGGVHACALLNSGNVVCWGANSSGELGDGTYTSRNTATSVVGLSNITSVAAGGEFTCALTSNGEVKCWGRNDSGQLGDGSKIQSNVPVTVPGLTDAVAIATGDEHACALLKSGDVMCWGKNLYGRVGNGTFTRLILEPAKVEDLGNNVGDLSAGNEHTCALLTDGSAKCWGHNTVGELGDGGTKIQSNTPMDVIGLHSKIKSLAAGYSKTCVILETGKALCWGWIGLQLFYDSPTEIAGNSLSIAAGGSHVCIITQNGGVKCIGENTAGQLGNGSTRDSESMVQATGLQSGVIAISATYNNTCALTSAGEVKCWGANTAGQLGDGTMKDSSTPVTVVGITTGN